MIATEGEHVAGMIAGHFVFRVLCGRMDLSNSKSEKLLSAELETRSGSFSATTFRQLR